MGLLDRFRKVQPTALVGAPWVANGDWPGAWQLSTEAYETILGMSPATLWRTQPYLRTVVTFLARNIAQLGVHTYQRAGEDDRQRLRDGVAEVLGQPNRATTSYELIFGLVADLALYDVAYWLTSDDPAQRIVRLPVPWVTPRAGDALGPEWYEVRKNDRGESVRIEADQVLAFHGWSPLALAHGSSPVQALRGILAEQVQAAKYREHVWQRGGKVGAVLTRPPGAPEWSDTARSRFKQDWDSQFTGDGPQVGGTPLLEDGMTLQRVDFSAKDMEFVNGARLALNTVASVYHINPTMIGLLDNANYSNVREFRRMLYGDTLGPTIAMVEDRLNAFLVPRFDDRADVYVEFNIEEKLQGNFEEQTQAIQSAVGRPWMTANEARALRNMAALDGGDDLVTPLNVLVGGQASPTDGTTAGGGGSLGMTGDDIKQRVEAAAALIRSGFDPAGALEAVGLDPIDHLGLLPVTVQRPAEPDAVDEEAVDALKAVLPQAKAGHLYALKATAAPQHRDDVAAVLRRFFTRQGKAVLTALGVVGNEPGSSEWWDGDRWDTELANDLTGVAMAITANLGQAEARALGYSADDYTPERTGAFLAAVGERYARNINLTTKGQLDEELAADDGDPAVVYSADQVDTRAAGVAVGVATFLAGFASVEAARQVGEAHDVEPTKTWVTGPNPRPEHARLDGETVALDDTFSNGQDWPGSQGEPDDSGCNCSVVINL